MTSTWEFFLKLLGDFRVVLKHGQDSAGTGLYKQHQVGLCEGKFFSRCLTLGPSLPASAGPAWVFQAGRFLKGSCLSSGAAPAEMRWLALFISDHKLEPFGIREL